MNIYLNTEKKERIVGSMVTRTAPRGHSVPFSIRKASSLTDGECGVVLTGEHSGVMVGRNRGYLCDIANRPVDISTSDPLVIASPHLFDALQSQKIVRGDVVRSLITGNVGVVDKEYQLGYYEVKVGDKKLYTHRSAIIKNQADRRTPWVERSFVTKDEPNAIKLVYFGEAYRPNSYGAFEVYPYGGIRHFTVSERTRAGIYCEKSSYILQRVLYLLLDLQKVGDKEEAKDQAVLIEKAKKRAKKAIVEALDDAFKRDRLSGIAWGAHVVISKSNNNPSEEDYLIRTRVSGAPCHGFVTSYSSSVRIEAYYDVPGFFRLKDDKEREHYREILNWVYNESPMADAFIIKDIGEVEEGKVQEIDVNQKVSKIMIGLIATRVFTEQHTTFRPTFMFWREKGATVLEAFILSNFFVIGPRDVLSVRNAHDHQIFDISRSLDKLKSFLKEGMKGGKGSLRNDRGYKVFANTQGEDRHVTDSFFKKYVENNPVTLKQIGVFDTRNYLEYAQSFLEALREELNG